MSLLPLQDAMSDALHESAGFHRHEVLFPQFAFVCPFKDGKAEVTYTGEKKALDDYGEHWTWQSDDWFYIDKNGNKLK